MTASLHAITARQPVSGVFTADFLTKLASLNQAHRWLRSHGQAPLAQDMSGHRPVIQVAASAGAHLRHCGRSLMMSRLPDGSRRCSVLIHDCEILWLEATQ
ncbi:MAG: hypothetical protein ACOY5C_04825 [Pseudomonadota bacterium]